MADNEFSISAKARKIIEDEGYTLSASMQGHISEWRSWYIGSGDFYKVSCADISGRKRTRDRASLHPARKVCREMASLILTEDTEVSVKGPKANGWLQGYLDRSNFWPSGQAVVEQAFSLGTAAWALWFDIRDEGAADVRLRRYDARMIFPLTYDDLGVSACAFVTRITVAGKPAEQLQIMAMDGDTGTYHIKTWLIRDGSAIDAETEGVVPDFDTESPRKPFGIFRPGIENVYDDLSPYGASIFADAIGPIKAVDTVFDAMVQEVSLKEVRLFLDEALLDMRGTDGRELPIADADRQAYRKVAGKRADGDLIETVSPDIRADQLKTMLDAALAELGDACGFGTDYFTLDKPGGAITAKEVVASGSVLMRTVKKHENVIRGAIQDVVSALLDAARIHLGEEIEEDFGAVSVSFDDSIITDTQTEKALMLSEIAAGVVPKWMYLERFYGMSEEEARAEVGAEAADGGF